MKVVLIKHSPWHDTREVQPPFLTIGKCYECVNTGENIGVVDHYLILIDDQDVIKIRGSRMWVPKELFITLDEKRNNQINEILGDDLYDNFI